MITKERKQLNYLREKLEEATKRLKTAEDFFRQKARAYHACKAKIADIEEKKAENDKRGQDTETHFVAMEEQTREAKQKVRELHRSLLNSDAMLEQANETVQELEEECERLEEKAKEHTPRRIETKRTVAMVEKRLRKLKVLVDANKERAANPKDDDANLDEKIENAEWKLKDFKGRTEKVCSNFNKYDKHLDKRVRDCNHMQQVTAKSCNATFALNMQKRGGRGKLIFDHDYFEDEEDRRFSKNPTLSLDVELHSQKRGQKYKTNQLSGGEATKTQLCFLMAMFKDSAAPFHVLDEIDVYLDNPNRNKLIKQLTKMSRSIDRQWIFLTPHDTSCIAREEGVKVLTMTPPEIEE